MTQRRLSGEFQDFAAGLRPSQFQALSPGIGLGETRVRGIRTQHQPQQAAKESQQLQVPFSSVSRRQMPRAPRLWLRVMTGLSLDVLVFVALLSGGVAIAAAVLFWVNPAALLRLRDLGIDAAKASAGIAAAFFAYGLVSRVVIGKSLGRALLDLLKQGSN